MAFINRSRNSQSNMRPLLGRGKELFAAILMVALTAALALRSAVSLDALAPAVATLLFGLAGATAGIAFLCRSDGPRASWCDIAGILTFVGVAITILIDSEQMVRLIAASEQPE